MFHVLSYIRNRWKYCVAIIIICGLINEWLLYFLLPWVKWPHLQSFSHDPVRLLLVGDPQLLGERHTYSSIFGYLARWDSDRYVSQTFNRAYYHVQPDIVIFLGDNLDEGEVANEEEYSRYLKRFLKVFHQVDFNKAIVLPGDNDIGGENEPPLIQMERRFDRYFKNDYLIQYKFLEFVKVNYMTQSSNYLSVPSPPRSKFRIVLSHIPLMSSYGVYSKKVLQHLQPHLILSAHEHTSMHLVATRQSQLEARAETSFLDNSIIVTNLTEHEIHEIMNPTCSYRMGTEKMGYGALVIDYDGNLNYTVLWLPSRFDQLFFYMGLLIFIMLLSSPFPSLMKEKLFFYTRNIQKRS